MNTNAFHHVCSCSCSYLSMGELPTVSLLVSFQLHSKHFPHLTRPKITGQMQHKTQRQMYFKLSSFVTSANCINVKELCSYVVTSITSFLQTLQSWIWAMCVGSPPCFTTWVWGRALTWPTMSSYTMTPTPTLPSHWRYTCTLSHQCN